MNGEHMKRLIADFNRDWPDVTRTREMLVLAEESRRNALRSRRMPPSPLVERSRRHTRARCRNSAVAINVSLRLRDL